MLPYKHRQLICIAIEARRAAVAEAIVADFVVNPFWDDRYGEHGRRLIHEDALYNLDFLVAAIRVDNPATLADFYRWLQTLLVRRGMCTRHVWETIHALERHLAEALPEHAPALAPFFQAGYAALTYDLPACRALAAATASIARAATARAYAADPGREQWGERGRALAEQDNLYHLSYLQDAVAANAPTLFGQYFAWVVDFLGRRGGAPERPYASLRLLAEELARALPPAHAQPFLDVLNAAAPPA